MSSTHHRVQRVGREQSRDVSHQVSDELGIGFLLESQELDLAAEDVAPREVLREAKERAGPRLEFARIPGRREVEEVPMADVVDAVGKLPGGREQRTALPIETETDEEQARATTES